MDLALSEMQEMLRTTARDFLGTECTGKYVRQMEQDEKGYTPDLWKKIAGLGWLGLPLPTEYGGSGGSLLDLVMLLEEMGRACFPGPYFSTVVLCGLLLAEAANADQKSALLPKIASGDLVMALALTEPGNSYQPRGIRLSATRNGDTFVLDGTKLFVSDAHIADTMICAARTTESAGGSDGITLFLLDSKIPGISITLLKTIGGDKQCEVKFDKVQVSRDKVIGELDKAWPALERTIERAAVAQCAMMSGGAQQVLEMAVKYTKERRQFGRLIGSFQAIQFHCANMLTDVDIARYLTYEAAWKLDEEIPHPVQVAIAKAGVGDCYQRIVRLGHQVISGVGYTEDHDMHLYYNRAKAGQILFGGADLYREVIANNLDL